ncbi:MAG: putative metal transport system rane protein [Parachlamydiales bacterium]|nr:putative metal transport system rane protein [Parachlamydiales bacterium]
MIPSFLILSLAAAFLASISAGVIGSYVVVKRLANLCGSISHSVLGGMGFFLYLQKVHQFSWCYPLLGAFIAAILSAWLIGWIHLRFRQRVDAVIAAVWSTGMSIGVIFLALTPGSKSELSNFLLGNLLWISPTDLFWLSIMSLLILSIVVSCYRPFLAICFDEDLALLQKIPLQKIYLLLLTLIALTIVLLIQIIGTVLTIAILTLPATTANLFTRSMSTLLTGSVIFSLLSSGCGITASYFLDWPPGATISLFAALVYFFALLMKKQKFKLNASSPPT